MFLHVYALGVITKQTRNENARINRDQRRRFEIDLRYIQMEIRRRGPEEQDKEEDWAAI